MSKQEFCELFNQWLAKADADLTWLIFKGVWDETEGHGLEREAILKHLCFLQRCIDKARNLVDFGLALDQTSLNLLDSAKGDDQEVDPL